LLLIIRYLDTLLAWSSNDTGRATISGAEGSNLVIYFCLERPMRYTGSRYNL
jgi:hypothetical protein